MTAAPALSHGRTCGRRRLHHALTDVQRRPSANQDAVFVNGRPHIRTASGLKRTEIQKAPARVGDWAQHFAPPTEAFIVHVLTLIISSVLFYIMKTAKYQFYYQFNIGSSIISVLCVIDIWCVLVRGYDRVCCGSGNWKSREWCTASQG